MPVLRLLPLSLARWPRDAGDLLIVWVASDERPVRGAAGLVDWRLCGRLSELIAGGRFAGHAGERLLLHSDRLPWRAALAMGLGPRAEVPPDLVSWAVAAGRGLGVRHLALAPPSGASHDGEHAVRSAQEALAAASGSSIESITLVETPARAKALRPHLQVRPSRPDPSTTLHSAVD
jgi:hypothetical protein